MKGFRETAPLVQRLLRGAQPRRGLLHADPDARRRIGGEQAVVFIGEIRDRLYIVALDTDEFTAAL